MHFQDESNGVRGSYLRLLEKVISDTDFVPVNECFFRTKNHSVPLEQSTVRFGFLLGEIKKRTFLTDRVGI